MTRRRRAALTETNDADPLAGIANLFDVSVVFIVGLMIALFGTYRMADLLDPDSQTTMVKTNAAGETEIVVKKGRTIEAYKVGKQAGHGQGKRLGTAYQLENGQMIYVPEEGSRDAQP
jgi:hypothetical protein